VRIPGTCRGEGKIKEKRGKQKKYENVYGYKTRVRIKITENKYELCSGYKK
jgi:hypothetical protein